MAAFVIELWAHSLVYCGGIAMIGLIAFIIFGWGKHFKCRTCGNENITSNNVLNYPNADMIIDVPERSIVKNYIK